MRMLQRLASAIRGFEDAGLYRRREGSGIVRADQVFRAAHMDRERKLQMSQLKSLVM